jgi:hypothetical protein
MPRITLAGLLEVELPSDWLARVYTPEGATVAFPRKFDEYVEPDHMPESLLANPFTTDQLLEQFAAARMARFVRQGYPERFDGDVVGGLPALAFTWTNGIADIATWFASPTRGFVLELHYGKPFAGPDATDEPARDRAIPWMQSARWLRRSP